MSGGTFSKFSGSVILSKDPSLMLSSVKTGSNK